MSTELEDKDGRSITFKNSVSLDKFSKALKYWGDAFKILSGREAKYTDFTAWLATQDFVNVGMSLREIEQKMEQSK